LKLGKDYWLTYLLGKIPPKSKYNVLYVWLVFFPAIIVILYLMSLNQVSHRKALYTAGWISIGGLWIIIGGISLIMHFSRKKPYKKKRV
jgi:hypothetical protein